MATAIVNHETEGVTDDDTTPTDCISRFAELHNESLKLLDTARMLVGEMRNALDDCHRRRPVVDTPRSPDVRQPNQPIAKSHRGGRVPKKHGRRRWRRPR
jgi:hypothetical protein